jgi:phenylacetate-coenzyme A ligase PaaK-like adenylate-forming protein
MTWSFDASVPRPVRAIASRVLARKDGVSGSERCGRELRALMRLTPAQVEASTLDRLRTTLVRAYSTVPYYREVFDAAGVVPSSRTSLDEFRRLPLLTKHEIRSRRTDLIARDVREDDLQVSYTGGTTGTQTPFYRDRPCTVARIGRHRAILERCGYRTGDRRALIWGVHEDLPASGGQALKRWFRRFASADEPLCCTVMTAQDMRAYYERLRRFRPSILYGYPNAIEQFARFIRRSTLPPLRVRRVFCTAELLRDSQRELFRETFGGEVFNLYCSREHGCVGFECERHDAFHIDVGSAFVEILADGRPARPGESGQIVVTDLLNRGMPFVRYVTGDIGVAARGACPCGCPLPTFAGLDGRVADLVYRPDGSVVSGVMLDDLFMDEPSITLAQFVQDDPSSLDVRLILDRDAASSADLEGRVLREVRGVMGDASEIRLYFVREIPRNPRSGKYQLVICNVRTPVGAA